MYLPKSVLLFGLILTLLLEPISGKRNFGRGGHSYPKSTGLSGGGGGHHSSGGLSGGSGHGYPSQGGSHSYPSQSHAYPSQGSHNYPSQGGSHSYPSQGGSHSYPSQGGSHGYPAQSGGGLSGNSAGHGYPANRPATHHTNTVVNNHYNYAPPPQISYASHGGPARSYPTFQGTPPTYVYKYKDSGSKYGTLLAGLALMNLGTLGVAAYAAHQANSNHGSGSGGNYNYKPTPGEVCKFAVKKENGDYEETRIDCQIISSFILEDMKTQQPAGNNSTVSTTTTVTNVTVVNSTNVAPDQTTTAAPSLGNVLYAMLPNGTLVPVNATGVNIPGLPGTVTQNETAAAPSSPDGSTSSVVTTTTTTTNTTLVNALEVKGNPVEVTPGMKCFVMRHTPVTNMKKTVPCGLLQTYAEKSIKPNSAAKNVPMFTLVAAVLAYFVAY